MKKLGKYWIRHCDRRSKKQGWALFDADGIFLIQKIDEPEDGDAALASDKLAIELVCRQALHGCRLSALALWLDGRPADNDVLVPKLLMPATKKETQ